MNMRKILSGMLATAMVVSMSATAFAEGIGSEESGETQLPSSSDVANSENSTPDAVVPEVSAPESSNSEAGSGSSSTTPDETPETPAVDPSAFVFGADESGAILGTNILEPGVEYKFPVSLTMGDQTLPMTEAMIKDYKFTYSKLSSNGVSTFEIKEYKGSYYLYVEAKQSTPVKPIDVKYNVKLVRKTNNLAAFAQEVKFQYGYDEANGDYINGLGKGDIVEIDNTNPVITSSQFDKIAKINDYKNVTMSGPSWSFTVNVTDESTKNMVSNNAGIKEILSKLPDQEFKFFNFSGKPEFNSTGRVALDVSDVADDWSNLYTYRYANGKLYRLSASHNTDEGTLEFRTNKLDSFVVTDKAVKDGFVVSDGVLGDTVTDGEDDNSNDTDDKKNPSTGAPDMMGAIAATALLGAAGLAAKKRSK